jgi:hypothetical protein
MSMTLGPQGAASPKLPLWDTVARSYSSYGRNLQDVLRASWLWLAVVASLVGMAVVKTVISPQAMTDAPIATGTTLLDFAAGLVQFLAGVGIAVAWHRRIILGEHPGPSGSNVATKTLWRYVLTGILIFAIAIFLWLGIVVPIYLLFALGAGGFPRPPTSGYTMLLLVTLVSYLPMFAVIARLSLSLPACAVGDLDLTFKQTWNRTSGNTWRLCWGILACVVPPILVLMIAVRASMGPPRPDLFDSNARDLFGGEGYAVRVAVINAIVIVCQLLFLPIWIGFLSHSYRHFFRRT